LKATTFERLVGRKVVLYPDLGCYELWKLKMNELDTMVFDLKISDLLKNNATAEQKKNGLDCADFFIRRDANYGWALTDQGYPLFWDR